MNTDEIQGALVATLSPDVTVRRQAEAYGQLPADGGVPVLLLQLQLSQALTLIASTDFPGKWPNLLPEIVARFADGDAATVQGMLLTPNSILKRPHAFKSDAPRGAQEFLAYEAPGAAADDEDDDEGPVERLQAAVVENGAGKE
ncbi:hypothetical protein JL721_9187 [Aureococcus anophagefferens]|nr:hypothetical protein JL721_9187 [Aureococcus anophagefferens]